MTGFYFWRWGFWFRVFGYGACFEAFDKRRPTFSERMGYRKVFRIGPIRMHGLKP